MIHWLKTNTTKILPSIIILGCTIPPISICWDAYIIPKWYGGITAIVICILFYQIKAIRVVKPTEWLLGMHIAAMVGIFFQAFYITIGYTEVWANQESFIIGTFDTPAGLALTICLLLPFVLLGLKKALASSDIKHTCLCYCAIFAGCVLVILSQSRTGLIALSLEGIICLLSSNVKRTAKIVIVIFIFVCTCTFVLFSKQTSSNGRAFIIEQTVLLIKEKPLTGHGIHGFSKEYMKRQEQYFKSHPDSEISILADEIKHQLNEFLLIWVNYGIGGLLVLTLSIIMPIIIFRSHNLAWMINGTIFIFCLFSYPLNYPMTWAFLIIGNAMALYGLFSFNLRKAIRGLGAILILSSAIVLPVDIIHSKAHDFIRRHGYSHALVAYSQGNNIFKTFPFNLAYPFRCRQFDYNHTHLLYVTGHLKEARNKIIECFKYSNGYSLHLLTGDICLKQEDYDCAITHYQSAHNMCPVRFAPLSGLLQVYQQKGDTIKADSIAKTISQKFVKVQSVDIQIIKSEAEEWIKHRTAISSME